MIRVVLSVWPPGPGGKGTRAKKVCVPEMGLSFFLLSVRNFIFPQRKIFWFWVGGVVWPGGGGPQDPPPPPLGDKHILDSDGALGLMQSSCNAQQATATLRLHSSVAM